MEKSDNETTLLYICHFFLNGVVCCFDFSDEQQIEDNEEPEVDKHSESICGYNTLTKTLVSFNASS
jgi:hypothetical protein